MKREAHVIKTADKTIGANPIRFSSFAGILPNPFFLFWTGIIVLTGGGFGGYYEGNKDGKLKW